MIGQTVGHFLILGKLGQGGMGEVFLVEETPVQRRVASKFLPEKDMKKHSVPFPSPCTFEPGGRES